jgi:enoyl-CoA hydratase
MDFGCVTCEVAGGVARVTLNRPAQLNAVSPELLDGLDRACDAAERDATVKVMTLTGAGRAFCAGADLKVVHELAPDAERWRRFIERWHQVYDRIAALP